MSKAKTEAVAGANAPFDPFKEQARMLEMQGWGNGAGGGDKSQVKVPAKEKQGFMGGMSP